MPVLTGEPGLCGINCETVSAVKRLIRGAEGGIDRIFWCIETFFLRDRGVYDFPGLSVL